MIKAKQIEIYEKALKQIMKTDIDFYYGRVPDDYTESYGGYAMIARQALIDAGAKFKEVKLK